MELCSGTLAEYFCGTYKGLKFKNEREILRQLSRELAHLHKFPIVHRDIKPSNILIFMPAPPDEGTNPNYNKPLIKLADARISKIIKNDFNQKGSRECWIAPEINEEEQFNFKSDIWALGSIFAYTLSGGKYPFGDDTIERRNLIKKNELVQDDLIEPHSKDSVAFELIKSMLAIEPSKRPTVKDVLKSPFFIDKDRTAKFLGVCKSLLVDDDNPKIMTDTIAQFKELVKDEMVDVNASTITKEGEEMSPIHLLCRYYNEKGNRIELVNDLLSNGTDVNNRAKKVKWCYEYNTDIFEFDGQLTPLHLLSFCTFSENGELFELARLLMEKGADVNAEDDFGLRPLHWFGTKYKNYNELNEKDSLSNLVDLFVKMGANINSACKGCNMQQCKGEQGKDQHILISNILMQMDIDL